MVFCGSLKCDPLDLIEGILILPPVIKVRGARAFVRGDVQRRLKLAAILQVRRSARGNRDFLKPLLEQGFLNEKQP
jgi:hypothetical protein